MSSKRRLVCSAPGRAGIIGNPTDMYGGSVLSCSVGMRAWVTITSADDPVFCTNGTEVVLARREDLRPQGDYFDIPRAILDYFRLPRLACRVEYYSELPVGSGMSSSTALLVAMLHAILTWQGRPRGNYQLAETARYIELNHLKIVGGYQDAYMCTFGGLNYMDFRGKQFYRETEAELFATVEPLAGYVSRLPFLLAFTGVHHSSNRVHKPLRERWLEGDPEVRAGYERITELARAGKKALLLEDWDSLARLMNENHAVQRQLGGSGEANEALIAAALAAGAPAAKLAGAGDGGTIIILWPDEDMSPLEEAMRRAGAQGVYRLEIARGATVESDGPVEE
ncbi:MAG: galactokinase family protein [Anaerolineae bacterium]|jgi:galactokinase/mevalonate kinase-like predicted kinase